MNRSGSVEILEALDRIEHLVMFYYDLVYKVVEHSSPPTVGTSLIPPLRYVVPELTAESLHLNAVAEAIRRYALFLPQATISGVEPWNAALLAPEPGRCGLRPAAVTQWVEAARLYVAHLRKFDPAPDPGSQFYFALEDKRNIFVAAAGSTIVNRSSVLGAFNAERSPPANLPLTGHGTLWSFNRLAGENSFAPDSGDPETAWQQFKPRFVALGRTSNDPRPTGLGTADLFGIPPLAKAALKSAADTIAKPSPAVEKRATSIFFGSGALGLAAMSAGAFKRATGNIDGFGPIGAPPQAAPPSQESAAQSKATPASMLMGHSAWDKWLPANYWATRMKCLQQSTFSDNEADAGNRLPSAGGLSPQGSAGAFSQALGKSPFDDALAAFGNTVRQSSTARASASAPQTSAPEGKAAAPNLDFSAFHRLPVPGSLPGRKYVPGALLPLHGESGGEPSLPGGSSAKAGSESKVTLETNTTSSPLDGTTVLRNWLQAQGFKSLLEKTKEDNREHSRTKR